MRIQVCMIVSIFSASLFAGNESSPLGEPELEHPTLKSLGVYWKIKGDDNKNATIATWYRKTGDKDWKTGLPLFRCERNQPERGKHGFTVGTPKGGWLFAGSLLLLDSGTSYEWKLTLKDPDGGDVEKIIKASTSMEPLAPKELKTFHVIPGKGGGSGTKEDPFKGLAAAQEKAVPGTLFLLGAGTYKELFTASKSGAKDKPVIWRGAGMDKTIFNARQEDKKDGSRGLSCGDVHDLWFEDLTIRHGQYGIVAHRSYRMVFRRLRIHE